MPRGARLGGPGVLHHVMVRGIERRAIFRGDRDRREFVSRPPALTEAHGAILSNHALCLVREGGRPVGWTTRPRLARFPRVLVRMPRIFGVSDGEITAGSRRRPAAAARAAVGAVAVTGLVLPVTWVARALGVTPMPLLRTLPRGAVLLKAPGLAVAQVAREAGQQSY